MKPINKALFLDLDHTLIVTKSGLTFPEHKDDWKFNRHILKKVEEYVDQDFMVMIVSNQGGIESGHIRLNDFRLKLKQVMNGVIVETGLPLSSAGSRFTVSNNKNDFFRKPNPGMAYDLALSYILNLSDCVMVGDMSGKVLKSAVVYHDENSLTKWSTKDGKHLTEETASHVKDIGSNMGKLEIRQSDSDLRFAMNAGMYYIDVQDFLFDTKDPRRLIDQY